ncbi:unnamed protein product [Phytophthora fragariaefolia]|uniref:Unnamed protein product n=1 Tax=Phytophthora fragariaefolia TaxID=1490495 RepID=A0A9W7D564_9STRA|nr:unnamed protein product [Phytophthora fragariaefolia]
MKVEPAVRKEAHLSTVQEDQVLEDMEVSSLKSSGTASIRTPVQARSPPVSSAEVQAKVFVADQVRRWERDVSERSFPPNIKYDWPHDHLDSSSYLSTVLTTSEYLRKRTSMAAEADAWVAEMELTRRTFGSPGDWTAVTIPVAHFYPRECPDAAVRGRFRILELGHRVVPDASQQGKPGLGPQCRRRDADPLDHRDG